MFQGTDYWIPGKKYMGDGVFPEKLCTLDLNDMSMETIEFINSNFITHPEWDVLAAGKVLVLAEVLGKWMFAIKDYHYKRHSLTSLRQELSELKEAYGKESQTVAEQWKSLENDEQTLEQFKDDLEKMENERNQINQDKIACRDKLDKGTKLFEEMAGESSSWKRELADINHEIDNLLGNVLVYAASICLLPAFHFDKRYVLTHSLYKLLRSPCKNIRELMMFDFCGGGRGPGRGLK